MCILTSNSSFAFRSCHKTSSFIFLFTPWQFMNEKYYLSGVKMCCTSICSISNLQRYLNRTNICFILWVPFNAPGTALIFILTAHGIFFIFSACCKKFSCEIDLFLWECWFSPRKIWVMHLNSALHHAILNCMTV